MNTATKKKIYDLILADALEECMDEEIKKFENLKPETPHIFSKEYEKKKRKLINSVGRKEKVKNFKRIAVKAAISLSIAFSVIFCGLLAQPEVYAAVQNVFRDVFDKYDKYEYAGSELTVENFDDSFRLGYVPDGYYLSTGNYSPSYIMLTYTNEVDDIIFQYGIANDLTAYYDNEHNLYSEFEYNGVVYYFYESNNNDFKSMLIWFENGYSFSVTAHLSKEEFVEIAENLEKWGFFGVFFLSERF